MLWLLLLLDEPPLEPMEPLERAVPAPEEPWLFEAPWEAVPEVYSLSEIRPSLSVSKDVNCELLEPDDPEVSLVELPLIPEELEDPDPVEDGVYEEPEEPDEPGVDG